ncbi:MAG: glutamate racemase [Treponemataceae bacterium]
MRQGPVVFIDSGVGGLPYYGAFKNASPTDSTVYVADRFHFPYGPKSKDELSRIVIDLAHRIIRSLDPEMIVIACNSASVSALDALRAAFPDLPVVGTVPAVKPAALYSKKRRIGVLATERTVNDPYTAYLSKSFAPDCALVGMAAPELVEFVEKEYMKASDSSRFEVASSYIKRFRALDVDAVVLGCTHFLFLAEEFKKSGGDDIAVFDSREGVAKRALSVLREKRNGNPAPRTARDRFFVTGSEPYEEKWSLFASYFDLDFSGALESFQ